MRGNNYQYSLIFLGIISFLLFGVFFYREMFPEYKIYQNDYIALEKFRSSYTHEPPPAFKTGIKQILLERSDKGNPTIDRCISCHVALEYPHFSPTKIDRDSTGKVRVDQNGFPIQIKNENDVWGQVNQKIADLEDDKVNAQLEKEGSGHLVKKRLEEAEELKALKTAHVGENTFDVTKVLAMHPLMGKETRPFEFHPIEEYGCTSCHNGNGRGITTLTAHGPLLDGQYEKEFTGETPIFTEIDPENDPRFSKIFNGKPGHNLLFQTTPIYVGALIQAKCMQCHLSSPKALANAIETIDNVAANGQNVENRLSSATDYALRPKKSDLDLLTANYHRGEELFVEQACYACHRIAGFARGGVGPELTQEGESYPWFVKESVVWPQADLHTSAMPNFVLDHEELEDITTYLLSLNGKSQAISSTDYKKTLQRWEAGHKLPWEKPISPVQMQDTGYAMTVFASEGCAACHRLKGYDSNVGFKIEKNATPPSFEELEAEKEWFSNLIPEQIRGSTLVKIVESHAQEIDAHIADDVRQDGLLEEIEKAYPKLLESFYTPFKFAARSKNAHFKSLAEAESDPAKKEDIVHEANAWKKRMRNLMFLYAQEYGVGRLIGPRPNWSGIFRSDEWLMEHFKNPTAHVPRSIMPVFPFDETKFYALTLMLDTLALQNRKANRAIWSHQGFNPEMAYNIYCAQCHGDFLQGNGPVATWIYPIPKNLNNAEFLRNLTRERVVESITHGVKGTPMPPWGETAQGKSDGNSLPVLNAGEINSLVDWLFSSLPGSQVIRSTQDVEKWNYSPEDILKELHKEGTLDQLKKSASPIKDAHSKNQEFDVFFKGEELLASLSPSPVIAASINEPSLLFDITNNPSSSSDPHSYFIKKKYYTPENIQEGQRYFELNCAACHGKDADGAGLRASTMAEAKPRMLTNLDWIKTRDDLRLLRSIKFGIPGTAMSPWGDMTSSLQRLQLVMFIRTLSEERSLREKLAESLYKTFGETDLFIEKARKENFKILLKAQSELVETQAKRKALFNESDMDSKEDPSQLLPLYEKELSLKKLIQKLNDQDSVLLNLKALVKEEQSYFNSTGLALIQNKQTVILGSFLHLIDSLANRFNFDGQNLTYHFTKEQEEQFIESETPFNQTLDKQISELKALITTAEGKLPENAELITLSELRSKLTALTKLKVDISTTFARTPLLRQKEQELLSKVKTP